MCDACQTNKKEKTGDEANPRFFLHPYFDMFVANQVIALSIEPPFATPTFDLAPVASLTASQSALVGRHIRELGILTRYARFFRSEYLRLLKLVDQLRTADLDVEEHLTSFRDRAVMGTANSWDHVFFAAVLSDPALTAYLTASDLPAFR